MHSRANKNIIVGILLAEATRISSAYLNQVNTRGAYMNKCSILMALLSGITSSAVADISKRVAKLTLRLN